MSKVASVPKKLDAPPAGEAPRRVSLWAEAENHALALAQRTATPEMIAEAFDTFGALGLTRDEIAATELRALRVNYLLKQHGTAAEYEEAHNELTRFNEFWGDERPRLMQQIADLQVELHGGDAKGESLRRDCAVREEARERLQKDEHLYPDKLDQLRALQRQFSAAFGARINTLKAQVEAFNRFLGYTWPCDAEGVEAFIFGYNLEGRWAVAPPRQNYREPSPLHFDLASLQREVRGWLDAAKGELTEFERVSQDLVAAMQELRESRLPNLLFPLR